MKNFFGSIFINRDKLLEAGINYPIKVEYYKITDEERTKQENHLVYGVQIIKTEYKPEYTKVENKKIKYVTNDEIEANQILNIFKINQVTPINSEEVIVDLFRKNFNTF